MQQFRLPEAVTAFRKAIALRDRDIVVQQQDLGFVRPPQFNNASVRHNLGIALHIQKRLAEAEEAYRAVLALQPDFVETHYLLGLLLRDAGRLAEALVELRAAEQLGAKRPGMAAQAAQRIRECETMVAQEER